MFELFVLDREYYSVRGVFLCGKLCSPTAKLFPEILKNLLIRRYTAYENFT